MIAVEFAFHVLWDPASVGINDSPPYVFASVTRNIVVPNVGSVMVELAGPSGGAGGAGFGSVPVYAEYVDGACAFADEQSPAMVIMLKMTATTDLLRCAKDNFIRLFPSFPIDPAHVPSRLRSGTKQLIVVKKRS